MFIGLRWARRRCVEMVLRLRRLGMSCRLVERHRVFFGRRGQGGGLGGGGVFFSLWFQAGILKKKMSVIDFGFYGSA